MDSKLAFPGVGLRFLFSLPHGSLSSIFTSCFQKKASAERRNLLWAVQTVRLGFILGSSGNNLLEYPNVSVKAKTISNPPEFILPPWHIVNYPCQRQLFPRPDKHNSKNKYCLMAKNAMHKKKKISHVEETPYSPKKVFISSLHVIGEKRSTVLKK